MSLVGRVFSNRYEIQREVAQGGMAEVYLARDSLLDRPVALKALFPEYAREPSFVERFRREAQNAAALNHPNIVAIYDWGQEAGTYFIVMEFVEGRSLRDLIRTEGPIDPGQATDIAADIASALAAAHRAGVVHRDVKPGNVLITRSGQVKVTDFGIARAGTTDGLTQTGSVMGTATYFSPEQAQGLPVDGRSDVYSLGVVLYEMVTGVAPFTGDSPVAVAYKHVREEPVPPSRRNPLLPSDLEQIILTAMAKDAGLRYQSADDLRSDLLRFRRGRPPNAAPVTAIVSDMPAATAAVPVAAAGSGGGPPDATQVAASVPMGPAGPPRRKRGLATTITVLVLVLAVGGVLWLAFVQGEDDSGAQKKAVPDVVGLLVDEAKRILEDEGFEVAIESVVREGVRQDEVVDQDPGAGTKLARGETVKLEVNGGIEMPDLTGRNALEAIAELDSYCAESARPCFDYKEERRFDDELAKDLVLETEPRAGETVAKGDTITLVVSNGSEPVKVPNVVNLDATDAAAQLGAAGFRVATVRESSDTVPEGRVIRTEPGANQEAPEGSEVKMFVSTGPETALVPDVRGQLEADAIAEVQAAGLQPSIVEQASTPGNDGRVIDVEPAVGTEVPKGSVVVLTVGVSIPVTTAPTTTAGP